jgi:hypothetical protein
VACQRQHWSSHKRQCRALAQVEYDSIFVRHPEGELKRILTAPDPSELPLLLKLSATTWTTRPRSCHMHVNSLNTRATLLNNGRPVPGDTKEGLIRLLKRATTELPWPELPIERILDAHLKALGFLAAFDEPEAAVEILSRHTEDVERHVVAPSHRAKYYLQRLDWLLSAARKVEGDDEEKRDAYVAEAKGVMARATQSLRGLRLEDWSGQVHDSASTWRPI